MLTLSHRTLLSLLKSQYHSSPLPALINYLDFWTYWIAPPPPTPEKPKANFLLTFLHPEIFADYHILRAQIPPEISSVDVTSQYTHEVLKDAYSPPAMRMRTPRIWIPRDGLGGGVTEQEVRHCNGVKVGGRWKGGDGKGDGRSGVECREEEAWVDERTGQVRCELEGDVESWTVERGERVRF